MKIDLAGQVAYVTGGNKGIGWACAKLFAQCGASVAICGRNTELNAQCVEELQSNYQVDALGIECDVSDAEQVKKAFKQLKNKFGQLDILVNNAGIMHSNLLMFSSIKSFEDMTAINVNGVLYNQQMAVKLMARREQGCIINISSIVGRLGAAGQIAYSGTKAAIIGITQASAKELAEFNIRVNAVAPGFIETDLLKEFDQAQRDKVLNTIKMNRLGSADDVAKTVLFLASDMSSYITGQVLGVDGGMVV